MKNAIAITLLCVATTAAPLAIAADPVAESMFQEALGMMREGRFEEACRVLEASQKLEAKSGTLVVLGSCHEQIGRTATAWAEYKEAAALARSEGREHHAAKATELARALEPRLSMLRLDAQLLQGGVTVVVKLDGASVVDGSLGVAFAVDPGEHTISASAPGRRDWSTTVRVAPDGDRQIVSVPMLEPAPDGSAPAWPVAVDRGHPRVQDSSPLPVGATPAEPIWPWVVGGLGVVALGGSGLALAISRNASAELDDRCGPDRSACPSSYDFEGARGREVGGFGAFVGLGVAGLGAVTAAVVGLARAHSEEPSFAPTAAATDGGAWLGVQRRF